VLAPFSWVSVLKKPDNSSLFRHLQVRNREKSDAAQRKSFTTGAAESRGDGQGFRGFRL
jgi:hypothetical protein